MFTTLTRDGLLDVEQHKEWVARIKKDALDSLIQKAIEGLGYEPSVLKAELWLGRIIRALINGVQSSQEAYLGHVEEIVGGRLLPKSFRKEFVLTDLVDETTPPEVGEFLQACALAAFDALDPFGNELISHITTGCVLHAYVAGRDREAILSRIGRPTNERAVLDTPILLQLLGPSRLSNEAKTTIMAAISNGWDVVAFDHSIEELQSLLANEIPELKKSFIEAANAGLRREWFASLSMEHLPAVCIESINEGLYKNPDGILEAAQSISKVLESIGVTVRPHHNESDQLYVDRCREELTSYIADRNARYRSKPVIQRDAETMAAMWRRRRRQSVSKWPGAWIITTDRAIGPVYANLDQDDKVSATLTLAQWSSLISLSADGQTVAQLAKASAGQLVDEAMWLLPARFPSSTAMALAKQISPHHGGSGFEISVAQLTLDEAFAEAAQSENPVSLAASV